MTISDKNLRDRDKDINDIVSVLTKFHNDFKEVTAKSLRIDKSRNEREIDDKKRQTLNNVTNTSVSNITNISSVAKDKSRSSVSSIIIPASKSDKEVVSELKGINRTIEKSSKEDTKKSKTIFKNSILQARILEGGFNYIKDFFFGGASDTDRIVNAVNNVEQAILKEDKIILDERSRFQKIAEKLPDANIVKQVSKTIPTTGSVAEKVTSSISATVAGKDIVGEFMGAILSSLSTTKIPKSKPVDSKDPKVKKSIDDSTGNIASMFVDALDKGITGVLGTSLLNKKTGFLSAVALFGSSSDFGLSAAILNPMKTLKLGYKTFKVALGALVDRPLLQGIALSSTTFGALGGVMSTVLLPLAKIIRPLTKELPSLGDAFKSARTKIADAFKGTREFLSEHTGKMLSKFRKSMGKKFIATGVIMGALGAKMLGIMGTVMLAASTLWAGIVAVAIAAWPFIVGGLIVAGIIGIGYYVYKQWANIKAKWNEYIVQPIVDFMISAVDKFKSIKEKITGAISGFFEYIISNVRSAIELLPYGKNLAKSLFGEKTTETVSSSDTTQTSKTTPEIIKQTTKEDVKDEETKKVMKQLDKTLQELSRNMNRQQQPIIPLPQSNLDDLGTLLVTMGG